jgi:hypothetical protein
MSKFLKRGIVSRWLKNERYASAGKLVSAEAKQVNEDGGLRCPANG